MVFGKYRSVESVIEEINKVTVDSVNEYIRDHMDLSKLSGVLLGPGVESMQDWWKELKV
ncbi:hypothetical protein D3C86_2191270 [compost metagenome]